VLSLSVDPPAPSSLPQLRPFPSHTDVCDPSPGSQKPFNCDHVRHPAVHLAPLSREPQKRPHRLSRLDCRVVSRTATCVPDTPQTASYLGMCWCLICGRSRNIDVPPNALDPVYEITRMHSSLTGCFNANYRTHGLAADLFVLTLRHQVPRTISDGQRCIIGTTCS
jgi:hypothetical protein